MSRASQLNLPSARTSRLFVNRYGIKPLSATHRELNMMSDLSNNNHARSNQMYALASPFHPVIFLSDDYEVLDLTDRSTWSSDPTGQDINSPSPSQVGRFDEARAALYEQPLFQNEDSPRCVHMGIDLGEAAGTEVFSFDEGVIYALGALPERGDYGHAIIIEYVWSLETPLECGEAPIQSGASYWALYGHLSARSLQLFTKGDLVKRGQLIGWLGDESENGGWPPHLHLQLSRCAPFTHDMPGAVTREARTRALSIYPDPRAVLGAIY